MRWGFCGAAGPSTVQRQARPATVSVGSQQQGRGRGAPGRSAAGVGGPSRPPTFGSLRAGRSRLGGSCLRSRGSLSSGPLWALLSLQQPYAAACVPRDAGVQCSHRAVLEVSAASLTSRRHRCAQS